jgi:hypothetical protein
VPPEKSPDNQVRAKTSGARVTASAEMYPINRMNDGGTSKGREAMTVVERGGLLSAGTNITKIDAITNYHKYFSQRQEGTMC